MQLDLEGDDVHQPAAPALLALDAQEPARHAVGRADPQRLVQDPAVLARPHRLVRLGVAELEDVRHPHADAGER